MNLLLFHYRMVPKLCVVILWTIYLLVILVILCFPSVTVATVGIFGHGIDHFEQYVSQEEDAFV